MNDRIQTRMLGSLHAVLRPIIRVLLRYGVTYHQFADIAKAAFVREAFAEVDATGQRANGSRVSVKTGLSRKEVRRLRDEVLKQSAGTERRHKDPSGAPARLLHTWHSDPRFLDKSGFPLVLSLEGPGPSFSSLVREVAGDVPAGAVRAELRRAAAISETPDGRITPTKRYYIPGNVDEKAIAVMSRMMFPLAAGIAHNSNPDRKTDGFIQRAAFSEGLSLDLIPAFRRWSRKEATSFIESIDDWIAANESPQEAASATGAGAPVTATVGVFYYEGPAADDLFEE